MKMKKQFLPLFGALLVFSLSNISLAACTDSLLGPQHQINESFLGESFSTYMYSGANVVANDRGSYNFEVYAEIPFDLSQLEAFHRQQVSQRIPGSSCTNRYHDNNDYILGVDGGRLVGSSSVRFQKWACATIKEPYLHKGWIPRTRDRAVKTKLGTHVEHPTFQVVPSYTQNNVTADLLEHEIRVVIKSSGGAQAIFLDHAYNLGAFIVPDDYIIEQPYFLLRDKNVVFRISAMSFDKKKTCTHSKLLKEKLNFIEYGQLSDINLITRVKTEEDGMSSSENGVSDTASEFTVIKDTASEFTIIKSSEQ